jgi:hypothetical protein
MSNSQNVNLSYLYRDASNYKAWGEVIFANPEGLSLEEIEKSLASCFLDGMFFVASQVGIPEVFLFYKYPFSEDDHFSHEFDSVEYTNEQVTDSEGRSAKKFIDQCKLAKQNNWKHRERNFPLLSLKSRGRVAS